MDMRPAPSADTLRAYRQAPAALAWLPEEVEVPAAWAEAGFRALGRLQTSAGPDAKTRWDQLVDEAGERIVSIPVDAPRAMTTIASPLVDGVVATTTVGGPSGFRRILLWAEHPATGLFHARARGAQPVDWLRSHDRLLARAGAVRAISGRNEWRQMQRRSQARTLDWAAATTHATRHKTAVMLASLGLLLSVYFGGGVLRAQAALAAGAPLDPGSGGLSLPLAILAISVAVVIAQRVYMELATRRLAASGPIPEVPPPSD
jgi:hypothetical protein